MTKSDLDKRICDVESKAKNTDTYREFITQSEDEFGLKHEPIDDFTDIELEKYIERLDHIWEK
ncbi:hypothetical protein AB8U03_15545 [Clostridium sp. Mt-5]|uniref:Uncharacterized protein n=1 Tax=Clostridium moutaii TaxID=3240932 RepID=A0ABV4BS30_9CLOT